MLQNRYLRQIMLLGGKEHSNLSSLTVGVLGTGGIGSHSALLCAQLGIKKLILIDRDKVMPTDLSRQQYSESDAGKPKVLCLKELISQKNSDIKVDAIFGQFEGNNISALNDANIILDGTDNYLSRKEINRFSLKQNIPWIFASALKFEAMLSTIIPFNSACFECWAKQPARELQCEDVGIMNTAVAAISAIQVQELINVICFNKPLYTNQLLRVNMKTGLFEKIKADKNTNCDACNTINNG